jgi:hypothetical protein
VEPPTFSVGWRGDGMSLAWWCSGQAGYNEASERGGGQACAGVGEVFVHIFEF